MKVSQANAPGKIILFGEHAVVYGRPAVAAPVTQLRASATVEDASAPGVWLQAPDLNREYWLADAGQKDPFARAVRIFFEDSEFDRYPDLIVTVSSDIPMASGLGSGAAMAAAVIKALARHLDHPDIMDNTRLSRLTYQVEKLLHGTPSGIDNTVVVYELPVFFIRRQPTNHIETLRIGGKFLILIADSGVPSSTKEVVSDVRRRWLANNAAYDQIFDECGSIAHEARDVIGAGDRKRLGKLMIENHQLLVKMGVSSTELNHLVEAALSAGALGAKMSGGGWGGNIICLVEEPQEERVREALTSAGAVRIFSSLLASEPSI